MVVFLNTLSRKIIFEGESLGDSTAFFFIIARKFYHYLLNPKLSKNHAMKDPEIENKAYPKLRPKKS